MGTKKYTMEEFQEKFLEAQAKTMEEYEKKSKEALGEDLDFTTKMVDTMRNMMLFSMLYKNLFKDEEGE